MHEPIPTPKDTLFATLPPEWPDTDLRARIRQATLLTGRKIVVLDDDPTGTQTVHDLPVLTTWDIDALAPAWAETGTTFYILTNTRRYPLTRAAAMNREIARNLAQVARQHGVAPVVISRSDSTLRGHYPGEVQALQAALEEDLNLRHDGLVIVPFFLEGGRYTIDDVHWVQSGDTLIPAAQTEFARDATFGYRHSNLRAWVQEKTGGRVPAGQVLSIGLHDIRRGGPDAVATRLARVRAGQIVLVNAASYRDLEVFCWGLIQAEAGGKRFLFRSAASFVKVRGGLPDRGLLSPGELSLSAGEGTGGLILVGSYVQRTTEQLAHALKQAGTKGLELRVERLLDPDRRPGEIERVRGEMERGLRHGQDVLVYTSRDLFVPPGLSQLQAAQQVSDALVSLLQGLALRPRFIVGKGGITSSDLATAALGVRQARVLGQIVPGVPVWRLGPESRFPGLAYVVFPGNVGGVEALSEVLRLLRTPGQDRRSFD